MAVSTNSNILIQGNTIDFGIGQSGPSDGSSYTNCIALNLDPNQGSDPGTQYAEPGYANIADNFLSGIAAAGTHIALVGGSTIVTKNTFIGPGGPNGIAVAAYISVNSPNDQVIIDNIFDSPFVDSLTGTNESLVTGVGSHGFTTTSTYHSNKNQTGFLPISKVPNLIDFYHNDNSNLAGTPVQAFYFYDSDSSGTETPRIRSKYGNFTAAGSMIPLVPPISGPSNYYAVAEGTEVLWDTTGTTANIKYTTVVDVDEYLPLNVQIISFAIGLNAIANTTPNLQVLTNGSANSSYTMWSNSSISVIPTTAYQASNIAVALANSIADVKNTVISGPPVGSEQTTFLTVVQSAPIANQVTPAQLAAATQYLFLDVSGSPQFYTVVPNTKIVVTYQAITEVDATQGGLGITADGYVDVFESPLIVKYRW